MISPTEVPTPDITQLLQEAAALHQAGQLQEAERLYLTVLDIQPQQADAHYNLGVLHMQAKTHIAAVDHFQTALQSNPSEGRYWLSTAMAMMEAGLPDTAYSVLALGQRRGLSGNGVLALLSRLPSAAGNPASAGRNREPKGANVERLLSLRRAGRHAEAEKLARAMTADFPQFSFGWAMLGIALGGQRRLADALPYFQKAIQLTPLDAQLFNYLGGTLTLLGRLVEAEINLRQALFLQPDNAEAHCNRGRNFFLTREWDLAEASCLQAIQLNPDLTEAHNLMGAILYEAGRPDEAEPYCRRAIELQPLAMEPYTTLGVILQDTGQLDAAESLYRQALVLRPDFEATYHNLLFTLNYHPDKSPEDIFAAYQAFDAHIGTPNLAYHRAFANDRTVPRRLKVGYVSPDFRQHAMRNFLEPVLARHAAENVEVFAYAELTEEDTVTERLRGYVDRWVLTKGMSDDLLAERIRADGIDVLVDLAGHTAFNRLPVFARKPAPVSLSWLGFGYTTGLTAIDYFLTDQTSAPVGSERLFSEKPWRLPTTAYVYRPSEGMGEVSPLPALENGAVTFGTLTRSIRINLHTIRVWAEILKRTQGSRLVINSVNFRSLAMQDRLRRQFFAQGVDSDRLQLGFTSPPWDVLRGLDIGLDCFPHNSGTTLFETLYMGLPYVTLAGRPSVGRIGSAILQEAGHPEWIATSEEEYIEKACALAADLPALAQTRARLRQDMQSSALMDEVGFTRRLEAAYREMFALWAAQTPPKNT